MDLQDEQIITLFFDVCRRNQRYHDRVSGSDDPSRGQYYCLAILDGAGTVSQRELADLLHIRPASAGELLNRLEAKGWIDRRPSPGISVCGWWNSLPSGRRRSTPCARRRRTTTK